MTGRVLGPGLLWAGLAIPAAGARLTLATVDADGFITPDATANPNAYPIGATKDGITLSAKSTSQDYFCDEILAPVERKLQQVTMTIKASLYAIADDKVAKLLTAGFGTQSTAAGYVQNQIGYAADAFTGIAAICPMREDPTKVFIFHMYKAINDSGMEWGVNHKDLGSTEALFKGYAITTRTPADQLGNYWWQT